MLSSGIAIRLGNSLEYGEIIEDHTRRWEMPSQLLPWVIEVLFLSGSILSRIKYYLTLSQNISHRKYIVEESFKGNEKVSWNNLFQDNCILDV